MTEEDAPYVCPGCHAVGGERCAPGCIDDEIAREHEDAIAYGIHDDPEDDECECPVEGHMPRCHRDNSALARLVRSTPQASKEP